MTPVAITMMIIAMLTVWGGLALSMWNLARHPEDEDELPGPEEMPHEL
ncbi:methionine/alanine import family NSS transporter small subunit [Arthrobacter alpinus]|nr:MULTISPECIES: methionine/alanine import family NSS transporter small subunit [Arthrobacter]MDD0857206.1 methionine/alanine import family NSS transporter small subunit [Arthrobacter alpinus]